MTTPGWAAAGTVAAAITAEWTAEPGPGPGGAILLFDRDGIRGEYAAGLASLPHALPFTAATPTRFASLTKHVFCTFALGQGLDLDAPLGTLLPDLPPAMAEVPAGRALGMAGGLPDLMQSYVLCGVPHTAALDNAALDAFTRALPGLDTPHGTEISYSNTGYRLLEQALARRGAVFGDWVEGRLNQALGTGFRFPAGWDQPVTGLADGYWRAQAQSPWQIGSYGMALSASGALTGSARDLATWLLALLRGDGPAGQALSRLATPGTLRDGRETGYGLGLALLDIGGRRLIGHGGHLPGFKNHFLIDPETGAGVILVSNREDTEPMLPALRIMAALLGFAPPPLAPDVLPEGLFLEAEGPAWIEHRAGALNFLGAREALYAGGAPGEAVSLSPYLPIALHRQGDGIAGRIGHAARHFHPARPEARLADAFAGIWHSDTQHFAITITADTDGSMTASSGVGPLHRRLALTPLDATRALTPVGAAPWPGRACLWLESPDRLRIATNRSRVITLSRS